MSSDLAPTHKWCAVDAEGDAGATGLLGVAVYSDIHQVYVTNHDEIRRLLCLHADQGYTFLAHNASYDIPVIWGQLGLEPEYTYYNDRLHHGSWRYDQRRKLAQIWDTLDLSAGMSVARLGSALGLPKYDTPQRLRGIDPDRYAWQCERHQVWECIACYAIRDAEIIYVFMSQFTAQLAAWGVLPQPRLASTALAVWKALDNPAPIGLSQYGVRTLSRHAYYGGRTECFKLGHVMPLYTADVTSMYPSVMLETDFPDPSTMLYLRDIGPHNLPLAYEGVATVDITVPPMYVPPLPRTHRGVRTYPIGRMVGTWTLLELRYAVSLGCVINRVEAVAYATSTLRPFTRFIGVLWAGREEYKATNDPRSLLFKLLMNNLYGRLGTTDGTSRVVMKPLPRGYDSREHQGWDHKRIGETVYRFREDTLTLGHDWCNVLWAAYVTGAARIRLHRFLVLQGDALVYCDTDSVFSRIPIQGAGKGLGKLELQGEYQAAIIAQPKLYALQDFEGQWHAKAKGVPRDAALRYLHGEVVTWQRPVKPKEALRTGQTPGEWVHAHRGRQAVPARRTPLHPERLYDEYGSSDTAPPYIGPVA